MRKYVNAIGQRYGKLLVLEEIRVPFNGSEKNRKSILKLKCQCDCGNIVFPYKTNVLTGKTAGCSNCQNCKISIQEKIGKLTVIKREKKEAHRPKYLCRCECGSEDLFTAYFLLHAKNKACKKCLFPKKYGPQKPKKTKKEAIADLNFTKHLRSKSSLIGKRNGRLKIIDFSHWEQKKDRRRAYYKAKCKCGNIVIVRDCFAIKSCGCLHKDSIPKGEDQPASKLTNKQVKSIREFSKNNIGYTNRQIASIFQVSEGVISRILLNKTYLL